MSNIKEIFLKNINRLMKERGIENPRQLALEVKINYNTVYHWFAGDMKRTPDHDHLLTLCAYFHISLSELLQEHIMTGETCTSYDDKQISYDLADLSDEGKRKVAEYIRDLKVVEKVRALQESEFRGQCCTDKQQQKKEKKVARRKAAAS